RNQQGWSSRYTQPRGISNSFRFGDESAGGDIQVGQFHYHLTREACIYRAPVSVRVLGFCDNHPETTVAAIARPSKVVHQFVEAGANSDRCIWPRTRVN